MHTYWLYMRIIHICLKVFKANTYLKTLSNHTPLFYWARCAANVHGMSPWRHNQLAPISKKHLDLLSVIQKDLLVTPSLVYKSLSKQNMPCQHMGSFSWHWKNYTPAETRWKFFPHHSNDLRHCQNMLHYSFYMYEIFKPRIRQTRKYMSLTIAHTVVDMRKIIQIISKPRRWWPAVLNRVVGAVYHHHVDLAISDVMVHMCFGEPNASHLEENN